MSNFSRREFLGVLGGGAFSLYLSGCSTGLETQYLAPHSGDEVFNLASFSPFDAGFSPPTNVRQGGGEFGGDSFSRPHSILWDKQGFLAGRGLPKPERSIPVVVVGGGISGLTTAYLLRHHQPLVLDQAARFGGNSKGEQWDGVAYSLGAAYFIKPEEGSKVGHLMQELGIDARWREKPDGDFVGIGGRIIRDFWEGGSSRRARSQLKKLHTYFLEINNEENERIFPEIPLTDAEMREYVSQLDQQNCIEHLVGIVGGTLHPHITTAIEHYCWSSFGAAAAEISAAAFLNFYAAEFGDVVVLPGGNSRVAEALLERVAGAVPPANLQSSAVVFDVRKNDDGVLVSFVDRAGEIRSIQSQVVVMCCPKFIAAKLIDDLEPTRREAIAKLRYRAAIVANVLLKGAPDKLFYDLYLLGDGQVTAPSEAGVTDIILANFSSPSPDRTVLSLYYPLAFDGGRARIYAEDAFSKTQSEIERFLQRDALPLLGLSPELVLGIRLSRWGHPFPVAATGLIANGVVDSLRAPFKNRVLWVNQDNWGLPALETAITEAFTVSQDVEKILTGGVA